MRYSHRFFLYAPVAAIVALAAAASIYWFTVSHAFARKLEALNGHQIAPGITLHFDSKSIGGFPFRIDAVLSGLRLDVATPHGPAYWQAQHFALHMFDYGRLQMVLEAAGKQTFAWHDAEGAAHGFSFTPALLRASAIIPDGRLQRFDIELYGGESPLFDVDHTELHIRRDPKVDALDLVFMADTVKLAPTVRSALGNRIQRIRLRGLIAPAEDWNALLSGRSSWRKAANAWRTHGGTIDIARLDIGWGRTEASGTGALALDSARRLKGLVRLRIAGYEALASEAARRHLVTGAQKGVLEGLMAEAAQAGHAANGTLPVTLAFKGGLAYVDQTPVGFLSPVY